MASNFEGFSHAHVIGQSSLFFILHGVYGFEIYFIEGLSALLIVLGYSGVLPLLFLHSFTVFLPTGFERPVGLAYVNGLVGAGARVFVDSLLFFLWCMRLIFPT